MNPGCGVQGLSFFQLALDATADKVINVSLLPLLAQMMLVCIGVTTITKNKTKYHKKNTRSLSVEHMSTQPRTDTGPR